MMTDKTIIKLLKPLVASGIYKDEKIALKDIIADYMQGKIASYTAAIRQMEEKYGNDLASVARKKSGMTSMVFEDDWMEWKAAQVMKEAWQDALRKLLRNAA
jgi:hypothetical protein